MGAIFYTYGNDGVFTNSVSGISGVSPVKLDIFDGLVGANNMCILTSLGITVSDTVQFFMTFDDFVHYYFFGKGLGSISIQGLLFLDCNQDMPGITPLLTAVGQARGTEVKCGLSGIGFTGVIQELTLNVVSEPETILAFNLTMGMISHTLPTPPPPDPAC